MPSLSEFSGHSAWGNEAGRWVRTSYNHPVSAAIDYFIVNLKKSSDITDRESIGHLGRKLGIKVEDSEEDIKSGVEFGPIDYEWVFKVFKGRCQEPAGRPIARIAKMLNT